MTKEELQAKLQPGSQPAEKKLVTEFVPCGRCTGVIYLGEGRAIYTLPDGQLAEKDVPSLYGRALCYLSPTADTPEGYLVWRFKNKKKYGDLGVCSPHGVDELFTPEMLAAAAESERPLKWMFTLNDRGVHAHSKYRDKWRFVKVEDGIWVALFSE